MMQQQNKKWLFLLTVCFFAVPAAVYADGFVNLVGLPGLETIGGEPDVEKFINTLLRIAIIAAALTAVVKLILAGAQYILSGVVTDKQNAINDIRSALIGLLIVLAAVALLRTINPDIVNLPTLEAPNISLVAPGSVDVGDRRIGDTGYECGDGFTFLIDTETGRGTCESEEEIREIHIATPDNTVFDSVPDNTATERAFGIIDDRGERNIDDIIGYLFWDPENPESIELGEECLEERPELEDEACASRGCTMRIPARAQAACVTDMLRDQCAEQGGRLIPFRAAEGSWRSFYCVESVEE